MGEAEEASDLQGAPRELLVKCHLCLGPSSFQVSGSLSVSFSGLSLGIFEMLEGSRGRRGDASQQEEGPRN